MKKILKLLFVAVLVFSYIGIMKITVQATDWREVYAERVRNGIGYFFLYDIDADGIPELFMFEGFGYSSVYTYSNGRLTPVGQCIGSCLCRCSQR